MHAYVFVEASCGFTHSLTACTRQTNTCCCRTCCCCHEGVEEEAEAKGDQTVIPVLCVRVVDDTLSLISRSEAGSRYEGRRERNRRSASSSPSFLSHQIHTPHVMALVVAVALFLDSSAGEDVSACVCALGPFLPLLDSQAVGFRPLPDFVSRSGEKMPFWSKQQTGRQVDPPPSRL